MLSDDYSVQAVADARRGEVPPLEMDYTGAAVLETHTVLYGRDGVPKHGAAILRTPQGARLLARVDPGEHETIALLTDADRSPIGGHGVITRAVDGMPHWRIAQ
jgi:acetyl-CoA C-acetyltransferase